MYLKHSCGGGEESGFRPLSDISLQWMIKELLDLAFAPSFNTTELRRSRLFLELNTDRIHLKRALDQRPKSSPPQSIGRDRSRDSFGTILAMITFGDRIYEILPQRKLVIRAGCVTQVLSW